MNASRNRDRVKEHLSPDCETCESVSPVYQKIKIGCQGTLCGYQFGSWGDASKVDLQSKEHEIDRAHQTGNGRSESQAETSYSPSSCWGVGFVDRARSPPHLLPREHSQHPEE